jgi:hypothetical protein
MISTCGRVLQETAPSVVEGLVDTLKGIFETYSFYILIVIGIVLLYFVVTRVLLRGTVYKTARKESMVILTMTGRERSLEYLERFGGIKGLEAQVIRYLRKHGSLPRKQLEKTFGTKAIKALVEDGYVNIV